MASVPKYPLRLRATLAGIARARERQAEVSRARLEVREAQEAGRPPSRTAELTLMVADLDRHARIAG